MGKVRYAIGSRVRRTRRWALRHRSSAQRTIDEHRRPAVPSACWAPHAALYFRPDGIIQACCATGYEVGWVTGDNRMSLAEIWHGARLRNHRERLEAERFDLGCQECELAIESGGRSSSLASHFDRWRLQAPYDHPKLLDFALSSRCNLQCVMCNGELSSAIRTQREGRRPMPTVYDDRFFEELAEMLPHAERMQFKGGEPFLGPENRRVWDLMIEQGSTSEVTVTTNATVWNADVERYIRALKMDLNISIDGTTAEVYDAIRVGANLDAVWSNVDKFQAVAAETGAWVTLSFCFMTNNWHQLPEFLLEVERRGVSAYVILVNQPDEYDVLKLPAEEITAIADALEARAPVFEAESPRDEWNRILDRLRTQVARPVTLKVEVVEPTSVPVTILARSRVEVRDARRELLEHSGHEPVEVELRDGVIVDVAGPTWADPLHLERWVGVRDVELLAVLGEQVGREPVVESIGSPRRGVDALSVTWPGQAELPSLVAWTFTPAESGVTAAQSMEGPFVSRWLIAPAGTTAS